MSDVTSYRVTGDWRHVVDDGMVDLDDLPDEALPTGHVVFTPVEFKVAVAGSPAVAHTVAQVKALIAAGELRDLQGRSGVMLAGDIGGRTIRWQAVTHLEYQGKKIAYPEVTFDLTADSRLTGLIHMDVPGQPAIVLDPRIEAIAARLDEADQIVTAVAGYAQDAQDQVPLAKAEADRAIGLANAQDTHIAGVLEDPQSETHAAFKAVGNATYDPRRSVSIAAFAGTDDQAWTAAQDAAAANGLSVYLPPRPTAYTLTSQARVKANTTLGPNVVVRAAATMPRLFLADAPDAVLSGGTIEVDSAVTIVADAMNAGTGITLDGVTVRSTGPDGGVKTTGVNILSGCVGGARNCTFDNIPNPVRFNNGVDRGECVNNTMTGWADRAVQVRSSGATRGSKDITIAGNRIGPFRMWKDGTGTVPVDGSGKSTQVRQPIAVQGEEGFFHTNVQVLSNRVTGTGTAHGDTTNPGTADLISVHRCDGFTVTGNVATGGGDVGITIARACRNGTVSGNVVRGCNSVGIALGSLSGGAEGGVANVAVTGNSCPDNYQNVLGDRPARCAYGIMLNTTTGCLAASNVCTGASMRGALVLVDATDCTVGENSAAGTTGTPVAIFGTTSGTRWNVAPLVVSKSADETVTSSTVQHDDAELSATVGLGAVYRVTGFIRYSSSTEADLTVGWGWSGFGAADLSWTADAIASNATGPNATINRTGLSRNSVARIGGSGGPAVVALLNGYLTTPQPTTVSSTDTEGVLTFQWSQGTAEVAQTVVHAGSRLMLERVA